MMMNRRFVNLVLKNYTSNMYALHRLDVSKHLFYPSTAEAEAKEKKTNNGGGGGGKPKPLRIDRLGQLPLPPLIMGFESSPSPTTDWYLESVRDIFVPLHGGGRGGGGEPGSRIIHVNGTGHTTLYDADSPSVVCVPDLAEPKGLWPMPFVVPGAGTGEEDESLYVLRSILVEPEPPAYHTNQECSRNFEVLDFGGSGSKYSFCDTRSNLLKWQPLPSPPLAPDRLESSTVVDGGRTICVSSESKGGTYCFNTATRQWRHAGDWTLPFLGRGEYLPEVETWVGFSPDHPHHLCSTDLSGVTSMSVAPHQEPTVQHVWEDFTPPATVETSVMLNKHFPDIIRRRTLEMQWTAEQLHLVRLGSGRLCIVKVFDAEEMESLSYSFVDVPEPKEKLTVLVGVEVFRGRDGGLRMVKHKTKRFIFPDNTINCVI